MQSFSDSQILAWTGSGEPPIPQALLDVIQNHADAAGFGSRIGFDCQIEPLAVVENSGSISTQYGGSA